MKSILSLFPQKNAAALSVPPTVENTALIVQDVQDHFGNPAFHGNHATAEVAERLQRTIVPAFREAGVGVYVVKFVEAIPEQSSGFYIFQPAKNDHVILKTQSCVMGSSDAHELLQAQGIRHTIWTGYNESGCLTFGALSARSLGYTAEFLKEACADNDLIDHDMTEICRQRRARQGITTRGWKTALAALTR